MTALKAQWAVTAEILPGQVKEEYTRVWEYTSADAQADSGKDFEETIFYRMRQAANDYASDLQNPSLVNIVKMQFMWL